MHVDIGDVTVGPLKIRLKPRLEKVVAIILAFPRYFPVLVIVTAIDYPASFNGSIIEVEPDVVLVVYPESMGEIRPSYVRAQLIHITPDGPMPIKR